MRIFREVAIWPAGPESEGGGCVGREKEKSGQPVVEGGAARHG